MVARTNKPRCTATKLSGQPCTAPAMPGSALCFGHDPRYTDIRLAAAKRGGQSGAKLARLRGLVPPRLLPIFDTLEAAIDEVHAGTITPAQATAMASVARALATVLSTGEVEARLRALEKAVQESSGYSVLLRRRA